MATSHYFDPPMRVATLEARTDEGGTPLSDVAGAELRLYADLFNPGVIGVDAYKPEAAGGMVVNVGSGVDGGDLAVVAGEVGGQGNYLVELAGSPVAVTVPAADLGQSRTDRIWVIVQDTNYDASGIVKARLGYREGNLGGGAPAPDPDWEAVELVAQIVVAAGVTTINPGDITDPRTQASFKVVQTADDVGAPSDAEFDAHTGASNPHGTDAADVGADPAGSAAAVQGNLDTHAGAASPHSGHVTDSDLSDHKAGGDHDNRYYTEPQTDALLADKSDVGHNHVGTHSMTGHDHDTDYYPQADVDAKDVATTGYRLKGSEATPRDITISDQAPSGGGNDGDLWFRYQ